MIKALSVIMLLWIAPNLFGQIIGRVDKKSMEFYIQPDQKMEYQVFGYQYPNNTTQKLICFSSHIGDVKDNYCRCRLGSYFDTDKLKVGEKISYIGIAGKFGKMIHVSGSGKKTIFYLPKSCFVVK